MIFLNIIESGFAKLGIWIITGIYHVIALIFQLFLILSTGTIVDSSTYQVLLSNIYVLLGVFLLFFVAFAFLKGMIDPDDKKTTESTKKTIINFVTSFVMIALLPTVFAFLFDLQTSIITRQNTIGKLFGYGSSSEGTTTVSVPEEIKVGSYQMVNSVMNAFLYVNPDENADISSCANVQTSSDLHNCEANVCSTDKMNFVNFDAEDSCGENKHSFNNTVAYVNQTGKFSSYRIFGEEIADGKVEFNFILALIGGIIVGYVAFSFCFDMALRMVKLAYYQIIAPVPIFMRIMPNSNMSGTFNTWTKKTLSCYFEVFVRVLVFYFAIYLVNGMMDSSLMANITDMAGWFMALLAKAFIIMGIVMFMKQAPKLISEITGIDSGSMKLGVKDKLKEGGFFAAGAAVGAGATALTRNAINAGKAYHKGMGKKEALKTTGKLLASTFAGGLSGTARGLKAGTKAGSFKEMKQSAGSGASAAVDARDKRASYKASHGGTVRGVIKGHVSDYGRSIKDWAQIESSDGLVDYYAKAAQSTSSFNDMSEATYKKKQEYIEQSAKVKALKAKNGINIEERNKLTARDAELRTQLSTATGKERAKINEELKRVQARQNQIALEIGEYELQDRILKDMQKDMANKKKTTIALAATKLAMDQKVNYSNDSALTSAYEKAILDSYKIKNLQEVRTLSENDQKIVGALLNGQQIDDAWIDQSNIIQLQDVLDNANIGRQNIKARKERERVEQVGNRPQSKDGN